MQTKSFLVCYSFRSYVVVSRTKLCSDRLATFTCVSVYVSLNTSLLQIVETMPHTENVQEFLEKLGDFYEMVDDGADGPVSRRMKTQRDRPVKNGDLVNGDKSSTDSSSETSCSDVSSHTVIGVYRNVYILV